MRPPTAAASPHCLPHRDSRPCLPSLLIDKLRGRLTVAPVSSLTPPSPRQGEPPSLGSSATPSRPTWGLCPWSGPVTGIGAVRGMLDIRRSFYGGGRHRSLTRPGRHPSDFLECRQSDWEIVGMPGSWPGDCRPGGRPHRRNPESALVALWRGRALRAHVSRWQRGLVVAGVVSHCSWPGSTWPCPRSQHAGHEEEDPRPGPAVEREATDEEGDERRGATRGNHPCAGRVGVCHPSTLPPEGPAVGPPTGGQARTIPRGGTSRPGGRRR